MRGSCVPAPPTISRPWGATRGTGLASTRLVSQRTSWLRAATATAVLATAIRIAVRSIAPFPYVPRFESFALSFLIYASSLLPAAVAACLGPRFARVARLLFGVPFGLLAMSLLFAGGHPSSAALFASGLVGFPAGVALARVRRARVLVAVATACVALSVATWFRPPAVAPPGAPSVLFVVLDTTAVAHLSTYGYAKPTSPTLDALARRSLVYRRAISPASWTIPAHGSIFSGLYPSELGFDGLGFKSSEGAGSIAADAEATGRFAYAISANPLVAREPALASGFEKMWEGTRLARSLPLQIADELHGYHAFMTSGQQVTDLALDWLDRLAPRGRPWLLFLNYVDPHEPYRPPPHEYDVFARGADADAVARVTRHCAVGTAALTPAITADMRALYDAEIAAMDSALGRLLAELARRGYGSENLLIIVTADHGEALGEHGIVGHLRGLPDTVLHVPLLVSGPGITAGEIVTPVQTVQLRATLRALLGLPPLPAIAPALPPWGEPPTFLVTEHPEPRWYFGELRSCDVPPDVTRWTGNWVAVERDGVKVVFDDAGAGATYRLDVDPDENDARPLGEGAPLMRAYAAWPRHDWTIAGPVSVDQRAALKSIGYLR